VEAPSVAESAGTRVHAAQSGQAGRARRVRYGAGMPELPDVELYVEHLTARLSGAPLMRAPS
jgi:hypothetical protein